MGVDALQDRAGYDGAFGQIPPMCIDRLNSFGNRFQNGGFGELGAVGESPPARRGQCFEGALATERQGQVVRRKIGDGREQVTCPPRNPST